jgi:SAM-dependent methyltransferase
MKSDEDRQKAREIADRLQAERLAAGGGFTDWFEQLYANAAGDAALVPWADETPHPGLVGFFERQPVAGTGRAVDVGCGIGDNAAFLARQGFAVTAFDLSPTAIAWAARRFAGAGIDFRVADLFKLPDDLLGAFNLVHETYTLQALPAAIRLLAFDGVASLLAPGGSLLVICRSREEAVEPMGPPWPLARSELARFEQLGLALVGLDSFEETTPDGRIIPHLRAHYRKPC